MQRSLHVGIVLKHVKYHLTYMHSYYIFNKTPTQQNNFSRVKVAAVRNWREKQDAAEPECSDIVQSHEKM